MKFLVCSTFYGEETSKQWYSLQRKFLDKTTKNYDHVVFLNQIQYKRHYINSGSLIAGHTKKKVSHGFALNKQLQYIQQYKDKYDCFLFLDSDAFPILENWDKILIPKLIKNNCLIASAIRYENLEKHNHPSVSVILPEAIDNILITSKDNYTITEYGIKDPQIISKNKVFPLARSNVVNLHPVLYGVYYNMFYHHGCGSRNPIIRTILGGYYHWIKNTKELHEKCTDQLFKDPETFINNLMKL